MICAVYRDGAIAGSTFRKSKLRIGILIWKTMRKFKTPNFIITNNNTPIKSKLKLINTIYINFAAEYKTASLFIKRLSILDVHQR